MHHLQADVLTLNLPHHLSPLLAVHLLPTGLRWAAVCFFGLVPLLGFPANLPPVEFNVARPGRRNLLSLSSGVGPLASSRTSPPPSPQSPIPAPCVFSARNAPRKIRP